MSSCRFSSASASSPPVASSSSLSSAEAEVDFSTSDASTNSSIASSPQQTRAEDKRQVSGNKNITKVTLEQVSQETRAFIADHATLEDVLNSDHAKTSHRLQVILEKWNKAISNFDMTRISKPNTHYIVAFSLLHEFVMRYWDNTVISSRPRPEQVEFLASRHNQATQAAMRAWRDFGVCFDGRLAVEKAWSLVNHHKQQLAFTQETLPKEKHASYAKQRQRLYHDILTVVRRSNMAFLHGKEIWNKNPVRAVEASSMARGILREMKHEEDKMASPLYQLVNFQAYHDVMVAHALAGDVDSIHELWTDYAQRMQVDLQPRPAGYYDALIWAYDYRFKRERDPQHRKHIALEALATWRKQFEEYSTVEHSGIHRPWTSTLRRVFGILQQLDSTSTSLTGGYSHAFMKHVRDFVEKHPECIELSHLPEFKMINREGEPPNSLDGSEQIPDIGAIRPKMLGKLLVQYCRSSSTFEKAEQLLQKAEEHTLAALDTKQGDKLLQSCTPYNIVMTGYTRFVSSDEALDKIEAIINRLQKLGADHPQFLPDEVSYTIWLSAIFRSTRSNRVCEADAVLLKMERSNRAPLKITTNAYCIVFGEWCKYKVPDRLERATAIIHRLPDSALDATLLEAYLRLCRNSRGENEALETWGKLIKMGKDKYGVRNPAIPSLPQLCVLVLGCLYRSAALDTYEKSRKVVQDLLEFYPADSVTRDDPVFQRSQERIVEALLKILSDSTTVSSKLPEMQWILNNFGPSVVA